MRNFENLARFGVIELLMTGTFDTRYSFPPMRNFENLARFGVKVAECPLQS
ncbi:hypothetical protein J6590_094833, partial [Homalodisca vitripennis]